MVYYKMKDYDLFGFEKATRHHKKYNAILIHKMTGDTVKIPFGDNRYMHFRDLTGLNEYPELSHHDELRRIRYMGRHSRDIKDGYYSPGYFSLYFLWN
jgi:hypothetical protein